MLVGLFSTHCQSDIVTHKTNNWNKGIWGEETFYYIIQPGFDEGFSGGDVSGQLSIS